MLEVVNAVYGQIVDLFTAKHGPRMKQFPDPDGDLVRKACHELVDEVIDLTQHCGGDEWDWSSISCEVTDTQALFNGLMEKYGPDGRVGKEIGPTRRLYPGPY
jgi:hypothetical protein